MWVCACYVCIMTEISRHFFGYQTSERNCFAQKHNIDVSIEPNVQLMFVYITKLVLISSPCTWPADWEKSQALVWTVSTVTAYAIVDSSSSKALVILESLLHVTRIWVEETLFTLRGLPADWRPRMREMEDGGENRSASSIFFSQTHKS